MPFKLSLVQKALVLCAVPLLLELCLLGAVTFFLYESEREAARVEHAKLVIARGEDVVRALNDVGFAFIAYDAKSNGMFERRLEKDLKNLPLTFQQLHDVVADDPRYLSTVNNIQEQIQSAVTVLSKRKQTIAEGGHLDIMEALGLRQQLEGILADLGHIVEEERGAQQRDPEAAERFKTIAKVLLLCGAVISLLGLGVVAWFNANTTKRLGVLMDNSVRLAAGEKLSPRLPGNDEIAAIDKVFHHAVDALTEAARKERAMIDNAADVICSIGADGSFLAVSPAANKLLGYDPNELVGKQWKAIIPAEEVAKLSKFIEQIQQSGASGAIETKVRRRDGVLADMRWSAHWSPTDKSMFCVIYDITDRLEAERFKQQFINMISHDIRTPLTAVKSTLEVLVAGVYGPLSEKALSKVERAEGNLRHTIDLLNNLLDIEKMSTSRIELQVKPTAVRPMLQNCVSVVSQLAESRDVTIEVPATEHTIIIDEQRVSQVIINLVGNALKFSPTESKIKIELEKQPSRTIFYVRDQGPGIPAAQRARIFEQYQQLPESRRKSVEVLVGARTLGTGLGLSICKAIVEAHGGEIGVDSDGVHGSTFWFTIPDKNA